MYTSEVRSGRSGRAVMTATSFASVPRLYPVSRMKLKLSARKGEQTPSCCSSCCSRPRLTPGQRGALL